MASRSFNKGGPRPVKFMGKAVETAYHGAGPIDQTAAILVEGAHELQGYRHLSIGKGFLVIDLGPGQDLFFYIRAQLFKPLDQKCSFDKGVVKKQGGAAVVLTSCTVKTILGSCPVPGPVHGGVDISELLE